MTNLEGLERRFHHWRARAKSAVAAWTFGAFPGVAGSALEIAAAELGRAPLPHFFSQDVCRIDPTLNDDLLELYGRAEQVLANRFAFFNSPEVFDGDINWEPAQSAAWRAELHACDYALQLACTFRISGEQVYARRLRYLLAHWIASNLPVCGTGWQANVVARRIRNWMLAADFARTDWERDAEFRDLVAESLAMQMAYLLGELDSLPGAQDRLLASVALLCASRFFAGNKAREAWQRGFDLLARVLAIAPEPWPQARLAKAKALMEWSLLSPPSEGASFLRAELHAALAELESVLTADGSLPLIGPHARLAQDELEDLAALAAVKVGSPTWKFVAGKFGILPYLYLGEEGKKSFDRLEEVDWVPQDSLHGEILRLTGAQKSALLVSAHLPAAPEEHLDLGSYELTVNEYRVVVDSGCYTPEDCEYFPQSRAHNILVVDGSLTPPINTRRSPQVDYEEHSPSCDRLRLAMPDPEGAGLHYQRAWFRLENDVCLILDWLEGPGVHDCTSLIHFYPTFEVVVEGDRMLARSRAVSFAVIPIGSAKPVAFVSRGNHPRFPSWYSPEFGVKFPSAVLALQWNRVALPWLGGALIMNGAEPVITEVDVNPQEGLVCFKFSGKTYDFRVK